MQGVSSKNNRKYWSTIRLVNCVMCIMTLWFDATAYFRKTTRAHLKCNVCLICWKTHNSAHIFVFKLWIGYLWKHPSLTVAVTTGNNDQNASPPITEPDYWNQPIRLRMCFPARQLGKRCFVALNTWWKSLLVVVTFPFKNMSSRRIVMLFFF